MQCRASTDQVKLAICTIYLNFFDASCNLLWKMLILALDLPRLQRRLLPE